MDLSKYRQLYVSETRENLDEAARRLVELERDPDDRDHIDTVFRIFHSIKGMSGTMGYQPMFDLAHRLEDLMERVRSRARRLDAGMTDLLLAGVDRMVRWVADIEVEQLPLVVDSAAEALLGQIEDSLAAGVVEVAAVVDAAPSGPAPEDGDLVIEVEADSSCPDAGMRGFILHKRLAAVGEMRSSHPAVEVLRAGQLEGPLRLVLRCDHPPEKIERFVRIAPEWTRVEVSVWAAPPPEVADDGFAASGDLMLDMDDLDDLDLGLDLPEPPPPATPSPRPEPAPGERAAPVASAAMRMPATSSAPRDPERPADAAVVRRPAPSRTIRVRTDWLDRVLDNIGDLLVVSQRMWAVEREQPRPRVSRLLGELSRLLGSLHAEALSVRMTPLSVLTDRLPRVVRDLSRQVDKLAQLAVHGADQRVDRAIIEALDAPLTHLLRNAIEHGIEAPDIRASRGKAPTGLLTLACRRERDEIVVELGDDGGGIDRLHLANRAARLGLMEPERARLLAERDLARLMCLPGLSSRDQAGALAGRGVGMDAVQAAVTGLGGRIEVETAVGSGTTIRLHLPRTPGISRLLLVEADDQVFGLPLNHVHRTGLFDPAAARKAPYGASVDVDGEQVPLHVLADLLDLDGRAPKRGPGVVVSTGRRRFVALVDRIVGQQDALLKPLGALFERTEGLQGVTLDSEGRPVFVLDLPRLVDGAPTGGEDR